MYPNGVKIQLYIFVFPPGDTSILPPYFKNTKKKFD